MLPEYHNHKNRRKPNCLYTLLSFVKARAVRIVGLIICLVFTVILVKATFSHSHPRPLINPAKYAGRDVRDVTNSSRWDKYAFALKTGKDVALRRTPIQLMTFLAPVKNIILIGEAPGVFVGDVPMIDVCTNAPVDSPIGQG